MKSQNNMKKFSRVNVSRYVYDTWKCFSRKKNKKKQKWEKILIKFLSDYERFITILCSLIAWYSCRCTIFIVKNPFYNCWHMKRAKKRIRKEEFLTEELRHVRSILFSHITMLCNWILLYPFLPPILQMLINLQ